MIDPTICTLKVSTDLCFTKQKIKTKTGPVKVVYNVLDFNRFMFHKTKNKNKKWSCKSFLQCFSNENVLKKYKEGGLSINGKQSVKLEEELIKFENYFKQIPFLFKIYADFECNARGFKSYDLEDFNSVLYNKVS